MDDEAMDIDSQLELFTHSPISTMDTDDDEDDYVDKNSTTTVILFKMFPVLKTLFQNGALDLVKIEVDL